MKLISSGVTCARCKRPVDLLEKEEDFLTGEIRIYAKCHGATELIKSSTSEELKAVCIEAQTVFVDSKGDV